MVDTGERKKSRCEILDGLMQIVPLAVTIPVPVVANFLGLYLVRAGSRLAGNSTFVASKVWLVAFPFAWFFLAERRSTEDLRRTLFGEEEGGMPRPAELAWGVFVGVLFGVLIYLSWWLIISERVDKRRFRDVFANMGITSMGTFVAYALVLSTLHAFMEEVVWRWFVFKRLKPLFGGRGVCDSPEDRRISDRRNFRAAVFAALVSTAIFVSYHVVSTREYLGSSMLFFVNAVLFMAGLVWATLFYATGNLWSCFVSHFIADVALFAIMGSCLT